MREKFDRKSFLREKRKEKRLLQKSIRQAAKETGSGRRWGRRRKVDYTYPFPLVNPREDANFKAIFTQPTEDSRLALRSFISAAIGREVKKVRLTNNEPARVFEKQRVIRLDLNCEFEDGSLAQIEMQCSGSKDMFSARILYYWARLYTSFLKGGHNWEKLKPVYQISVVDFNFEKNDNEPVHKYRLYDKETGSICSENLTIIVLDLTKLPEIHHIEEIRNLPTILKWCKFLKEADNTESREIVSEICNQEVGIMGAFKSLREVSIPQKLWLWYTGRIAAEADRQMFLELARQEGLAAGIAEGKAEGLAAGKAAGIEEGRVSGSKETAVMTAKNLLRMNIGTPEQIASAVNLPLETILELKNQIETNN